MGFRLALMLSSLVMATSACVSTSAPTPTMAPLPTATAVPANTPASQPFPTPASEDGIIARVVRVIDGDTVDVVLPDGSTDTVRLLGVDTPEISAPNNPYEYGDITDTACLDYWGQQAAGVAIVLLQGNTVTLVPDPLAGERGSFGRLLAYIYWQGEDFNAALVELGYARVYTEGDSSREAEYLELQGLAQA